VNPSPLGPALDLLRRRWPALIGITLMTLVPALLVTGIVDALAPGRWATIINGRLVPSGAAASWTRLSLSAGTDARVNLAIPVLVVLGWFVALAVSMPILAGTGFRAAWWRTANRVIDWVLLAALLALSSVIGFFGVALIFLRAPGAFSVLAGIVAVVGLYGLIRLAFALPAMLIDGHDLVAAVRKAFAVTRGRALPDGAAMIMAGIGAPALGFFLAYAAAQALAGQAGGSWAGDVLWVGAGSVVEHLALVVAIPIQAVVLAGGYRFLAERAEGGAPATSAELASRTSGKSRPWARRLGAAGIALLVPVPALATASVVVANPHEVPAVSLAHPEVGFAQPLVLTVLADGSTAAATDMDAGVCHDGRCAQTERFGAPCINGAQPTLLGANASPGARGCSIEAPVVAADITPDGKLLALERGPNSGARFYWCRLVANSDGQCTWGGAMTLHTQDSWSMSVAATPDGGFVAALLGLDKDGGVGQLFLVTCDQLDCPQPTSRPVLTVPIADPWQGGIVDVAVDRASGDVAVSYYDQTQGALWLGGCPAGCADGPRMARIGSIPTVPSDTLAPLARDVDTAMTRDGPIALVRGTAAPDSFAGAGEIVSVITCGDLACAGSQHVETSAGRSVRLAVDSAGVAFLVGNLSPDVAPVPRNVTMLENVSTGASTMLTVAGDVVAAAFDGRNRLRVLLNGPQGLTLVACATAYCVAD
jgi:hypothetical protein